MKRGDAVDIIILTCVLVAVAYYLTSPEQVADVDEPDKNGITLDALYGNTIGAIGALVSTQTISDAGVELIQSQEGCLLTAYYDVDGYSIGYGHHAPDITAGQTCTQEQADDWLAQDAAASASSVLKFCRVALTQNQLDALSDWIYNLGAKKVANATLWAILNSGNYAGVPAQLLRWVNVSGSPNATLQNRRQAECDLWNGGVE